MVHEALAMAEELAAEGIEVEVVDLRSIKPLDTDTVAGVRRAHGPPARRGRSVAVGRRHRGGGRPRRQRGFALLDAPPQRLNAKETPVPFHPEFLGHPPPDRAQHRRRRAANFLSYLTMPLIPIIMPQLGESIAEATVVNITVKIGDEVEADQDVMEVETNKAVMGVTRPARRVEELLGELQQSYQVGAVLGYLEVTAEEAARLGLDVPAPAAVRHGRRPHPTTRKRRPFRRRRVQPTVGGLPVPAHAAGAGYMSPA